MFDPRNNLAHQVADEVKQHFYVFEAVDPAQRPPLRGAVAREARRSSTTSLRRARRATCSSRGSSSRSTARRRSRRRRRRGGGALDDGSGREAARSRPRASTPSCPLRRPDRRRSRPTATRASSLRDREARAAEGPAAPVLRQGQARRARGVDPRARPARAAIVVRRVSGQPTSSRSSPVSAAGARRRRRGSRKSSSSSRTSRRRRRSSCALIENVQREDLDPIELAEAPRSPHRRARLHAETLAERLGKDRTTVANSLRSAQAPAPRTFARHLGRAQRGHARALLGAPDRQEIEELADKVVRGRLSVRAAEALVRQTKPKTGEGRRREGKTAPGKTAAVRDLRATPHRAQQARRCSCKPDSRNAMKGEIVIPYEDLVTSIRILARVFRIAT